MSVIFSTGSRVHSHERSGRMVSVDSTEEQFYYLFHVVPENVNEY